MIATDADDGNGLAGAAEDAAGNLSGGGDGFVPQRHEGGDGGGRFQEIASLHDQHLPWYAMHTGTSVAALRPAQDRLG